MPPNSPSSQTRPMLLEKLAATAKELRFITRLLSVLPRNRLYESNSASGPIFPFALAFPVPCQMKLKMSPARHDDQKPKSPASQYDKGKANSSLSYYKKQHLPGKTKGVFYEQQSSKKPCSTPIGISFPCHSACRSIGNDGESICR